MKTIHAIGLIATLTLVGALAAAAADADRLSSESQDAIQRLQQSSPRIQRLFNEAYGYAIFPSVGKGAIGIGGAEGRGQVFERGQLMGTARLVQGTVGAQLGGQSYTEVIFFESEKALSEFKDGKTAVSAALSAAVAADGAGAEAKYQHGVLVYTMQRSGLMFEASIGGQHFKFTPLSESITPVPSTAPAAPPTSTAPADAPPSTVPPEMPSPEKPSSVPPEMPSTPAPQAPTQ
jgi:lipid-binding SYLF domain-containing protein